MAKKKVASLDEFQGYEIKRTGTEVIFGCGAVTVLKKDLLALSKIVAKKEIKELTDTAEIDYSCDFVVNLADEDFDKKFKALSTLVTKHKAEFEIIQRVLAAGVTYIDLDTIFDTTPEEYLGLIG